MEQRSGYEYFDHEKALPPEIEFQVRRYDALAEAVRWFDPDEWEDMDPSLVTKIIVSIADAFDDGARAQRIKSSAVEHAAFMERHAAFMERHAQFLNATKP